MPVPALPACLPAAVTLLPIAVVANWGIQTPTWFPGP